MAERGAHLAETGVGALVLAAAAGFLIYALSAGGARGGGAGYELKADFGQAGSLATGADVRVAGVKVGQVSRLALNPQTYQAQATFRIQDDVKLPADSTAKITSDGLLGGAHVSIEPGGAPETLAAGASFENTQGAVDLFGLIGQVIRPRSDTPAAPSASSADPATAAVADLPDQ